MAPGPDGRFVLERSGKVPATLLELPGTPVDAVNATLGPETAALYRALRPLYEMPRMSTHAVAAIINRGVRRMAPGEAFVNVGVWRGFSLLSGMAANPGKDCIGVDDFSGFGGPREAFLEAFEKRRTSRHDFFDMGYERYLSDHHRSPIGLYFYDGDHTYDHQLRGLQVAERFFGDDCVVIVDDTNLAEPREATLDFIARSDREYALLLDATTADGRHPTFWDGVMVFQAVGASGNIGRRPPAAPRSTAATPVEPARVEPRTLVSVIVCDHEPGAAALEATIERALGQTWPNVEVLVVNRSPDESVAEIVRSFGDRIVSTSPTSGPGSGLSAAVARSRGEFVSVVDCYSELDEDAVQMGLALPGLVHFATGGARPRRALAAAGDINGAIPAGEAYILVDGRLRVAQTIAPGPAITLVERDENKDLLDDDAAIARVERLRSEGASFIVFLWTALAWLADRPRLARRLRTDGRCLVDNDRVLIFDLSEL